MSKKGKSGDDFGFPNLDNFGFQKLKDTNGIISPKGKLIPEPPLPNTKVSKPPLPDVG